MSRREFQIQSFIEQILTTEPIELDCLAVLDIVERYVESHVLGRESGGLGALVPLHFKQCPDCAEMFAVLSELARLEASDLLPDIPSLWNELAAMTVPTSGGNPDPVMAGAVAGTVTGTAVGALPDAARTDAARTSALADPSASTAVAGGAAEAHVPVRPSSPTSAAVRGPSIWQQLRRFFFGDAAVAAGDGRAGHRPTGATAGNLGRRAVPVFASIVVLGLGLGWWRAEQRANGLEGRLQAVEAKLTRVAENANEHTQMIAMLQRLDQVKGARSPNGAWVKVHFSPTYGEAMVLMGKLPKIAQGQRIEGWLMQDGSPPLSTGVVPDEVMHEAGFWTIPCSTPMRDATKFMLTVEPEHTEVVSVALAP
jgi:hypothetical protein